MVTTTHCDGVKPFDWMNVIFQKAPRRLTLGRVVLTGEVRQDHACFGGVRNFAHCVKAYSWRDDADDLGRDS